MGYILYFDDKLILSLHLGFIKDETFDILNDVCLCVCMLSSVNLSCLTLVLITSEMCGRVMTQ